MAETILETFVVQFLFRGDRRELEKWDQGIKNLNRQLDGLSRNFAIAGGALTAALLGVGRTIVGFEQAMNNLEAVLQPAAEDMLRLREEALKLGGATAFSASQVVEAETQLAQAGFSVNEIIGSLPHVLNLASAGQLEMGEAADLVRNQMRSFGLSIDDTQRITDVLAKAASSGGTTVRELGPAFRQVAPLARLAGLSIEQTAAFIVALRDSGLQAEQAGTAFRGVLTRLTEVQPPQGFLDALDRINVRFEDLKALAQQGAYEEIFHRLGSAELDAGTALAIFGTEAASAGASLTDAISKVEALTESLIGAEGWAERMRLIQEQGLPGAVAAFRSALEGLQLSLGEAGLTNWIATAADTLRGFMLWLRNADGWVKTTIAALLAAGPVLLGLGAALKAVSFAFSGFAIVVRAATGIVWLWRNAMLATRVQLGLLTLQTWAANAAQIAMRATMLLGAAATGIATVATTAFGVAMTVATGPVGLIILAVAGLIAGVVLLVKNFDWVKDKAQAVWNFILGAVQSVWNWVAQNWPLLVGILLGPFGVIGALVWKFRDEIIGAFASIKDGIIGAWQAAVGFIMAQFQRIKDIPGAGLVLGTLGAAREKMGEYAQGGVVPGPQGSPQLALVHGGEMVLPTGLAQMLDGFRRGPQALPQAPPGYGQMYRSIVNNRTVNVEITGPFNIQTQATDAEGIAQALGERLQDEIRNVAYDHDGPVER